MAAATRYVAPSAMALLAGCGGGGGGGRCQRVWRRQRFGGGERRRRRRPRRSDRRAANPPAPTTPPPLAALVVKVIELRLGPQQSLEPGFPARRQACSSRSAAAQLRLRNADGTPVNGGADPVSGVPAVEAAGRAACSTWRSTRPSRPTAASTSASPSATRATPASTAPPWRAPSSTSRAAALGNVVVIYRQTAQGRRAARTSARAWCSTATATSS